jgi:hypothetical protein
MNKQFNSYKELISEKQKLEVLLQAQKEVIRYDVAVLKAELQPVKDALVFVKKVTTMDRSSLLLNIGSDLVINTVIRKFILSRAGWLTKLVVPYLVKNYSSHFLAEQKDKWIEKLRGWLGHKNGNEHKKEEAENEEDVF